MLERRMVAYGCAAIVAIASLVLAKLGLQFGLLLIPVTLVAYRWKVGPALVTLAIVAVGAVWVISSVPLQRALALAIDGALIIVAIEALHRSRARERSARIAERCSQRRFERLFHASPVPLSLSAMTDGKLVEVNAAYTRMFGVSRSAVIGRLPTDAGIVADQREEIFGALAEHGSSERTLTVETALGKRELLVWSSVVELDEQAFTFTTFLDITEQALAREAARASEERMRELADNVREVFWVTDPTNTTMLYISPSYERMFGRRCADVYANPRDWLAAQNGEDRERLRLAMEKARSQRSEEQYQIAHPSKGVRTIHIAVTPILDASGKLVRLAGVADDVTDKLVLEAQMRQTQKLESLGLLAGGVAHDFNNILGVIAANASLLAETIPQEGENAELVGEIDAAVARATSLTRQLLAFSRKQVLEPVVVDLNAAVGDTRKMLRRMLGEDVSIFTSLEPELGRVLIDPGYLVQVLMNLAVNARDAMPRGGKLTVTTRNVLGETREVMLAISDSGCGMPPDVVARIFEPFYTTKGLGRGTGLGLSVVHGIIQQAGGRIEVESIVDIGTTMKIYLPYVDAPAEKLTDVTMAGATGTEQIVLVDDDMYVRTAASRSLRARGYRVLEASDAQGALKLLADHKDVALLVTDVVMPGIDGHQLVEAARQRRPSLKVLYISGYTDDAVLHHGIERATVAVLEKPFRGHTLIGRVRQVLDAA